MNKIKPSRNLDYGLDAPGLVKLFLIGGIVLAGIGAFTNIPAFADLFQGLMQMGIGFAISGLLMVTYSYYGKFRSRDSLIRSLGLQGNETVLDIGCGRGLLLIGAAKGLQQGKAIGIDLWSQTDLSNNSREAVLANAEIEGVQNRIEIIDGDMRKLPLADASVDVVVASMSIHNIPSKAGREEAIREAVRVLKPGGKIALLDFKSTALYANVAKKAGLDLTTAINAVSAGAAGSWSISNLGPRIVARNFDPGFFVVHFIKDLSIILAECKRMNISLPGLGLAYSLYMSLMALGHSKLGTQSLMLAIENLNGIKGEIKGNTSTTANQTTTIT